jgi:hypothetical protein
MAGSLRAVNLEVSGFLVLAGEDPVVDFPGHVSVEEVSGDFIHVHLL